MVPATFSPAEPPAPPRLRVLIVEDEPLLRWAISESLAAAGHTVMAADDGASAERIVSSPGLALDVILLDYRLPDSNDLGLLRRLRQMSPLSPVVLMTACNSPELTHDAQALGAYRVVDKPFEMQALESCLLEASAAAHG
jgi:DNA-binding NtrC family response regulator